MIALMIAPGLNPGLETLNKHYPTPLLPLVDRPFIQHAVEYLIGQGVTRFEFILSHLPEKIEAFAGRWQPLGKYVQISSGVRPSIPLRSTQDFEI